MSDLKRKHTARCGWCGIKHDFDRPKPGWICGACGTQQNHPAKPRPSDAFRGRYVRRGMVTSLVPDDDAHAEIWDTLARNLGPTPPPVPEPTVVTGVLCDCGCLLRDAEELCPACVIPWCIANSKPPRPVIYYRPRTHTEQRGAA